MKDTAQISEAEPASPAISGLFRALSLMGPAFIVGAWQFGPGNLASATQAGGLFGYALIWLIALSTVFMIAYTDMSVRVGLVSKYSIIEQIKLSFGKPAGVIAGVGAFGISLMFSVGNAVGTGLGLSMLFGGSRVVWTIACSVIIALVVHSRNYFKVFERLILIFVAVMAVVFVVTAIMSDPDWGRALEGFVPTFPKGIGVLFIALVGTNFSVNAAFYTAYATRQRQLKPSQYREVTLSDTIPGIVAPGVMTILVMIASAAAINSSGRGVSTVQDLAAVLEPVAGGFGKTIFALGFFGAAFTAMIANATGGGSLLADGIGWGTNVESPRVKLLITAILVFGATVTALATSPPVQLIIVANALTIPMAPFLGLLLILLCNQRSLMGELRNKWWHNVIAALGWVAILASVYELVMTLFFR
jgi:manganese transport protein